MNEEEEKVFYKWCDLFQCEIRELCDFCLWEKCAPLQIEFLSTPGDAPLRIKLSIIDVEMLRRRIFCGSAGWNHECECSDRQKVEE